MSVFDTTYFVEAFVGMLVILDPPGALPVFLGLTKSYTRQQRHAVAVKATLVAFGMLILFALGGKLVLEYLQISVQALQVSGGLLLLLIGLDLLLGKESGTTEGGDNIALVPLAVPLFAGPGVIVKVMVGMESSRNLGQQVAVYAALTAAMAVVYLSMRYAGAIHRVLGDGGTTLVSRLAGLFCASIAVQMMADGVLAFIHQ